MITLIQVILIVFVLFALSRAYLRYKDGQITGAEFAFWIVIWVSAIASLLLPDTVGYLSAYLGIGRPVDMIIYVAIILLFYMNFRLYVGLDAVNHKITAVVREVAIKREKKK